MNGEQATTSASGSQATSRAVAAGSASATATSSRDSWASRSASANARSASEFGREETPHRDGVAVTPGVVLALLDGVGERVAVVEDLAQVRFLEVGRHDRGLDADGPLDEFDELRARHVEARSRVGLDEFELSEEDRSLLDADAGDLDEQLGRGADDDGATSNVSPTTFSAVGRGAGLREGGREEQEGSGQERGG